MVATDTQGHDEAIKALSEDDALTSHSTNEQPTPSQPTLQSNAKAGDPMPGGSPCYYLGAASSHTLRITTLSLTPRTLTKSSRLSVHLTGTLIAAAGQSSRIELRASRHGGPSITTSFRVASNPRVHVRQRGVDTKCPEEGKVQMEYALNVPSAWLRKGFYEVQVSLWDSVGRTMTEFGAKVWMNEERSWIDARGLMG